MLKKIILVMYLIIVSIIFLSMPTFSQNDSFLIGTLNIQRIEIVSVGADEAEIGWTNSQASNNILAYGTVSRKLNQTVMLGTATYQSCYLKGLNSNQRYFYQIKNNRNEMSSIRSFQTLSLPSGKYLFSFAIATDIHYNGQEQGISRKGEIFGKIGQIIDNMIDEINTHHKIDFIIIKGDISHRGTRAELVDVSSRLKKLDKPVYMVVGNHDKISPTWMANNREVFGLTKNYYSFSHNGWHFVVLDSAKVGGLSEGYLAPNQLIGLNEDLNAHKNEKTMIFLHHMVHKSSEIDEADASGSFGSDVSNRFITNTDEFKSILQKHPQVISVNSGHAHLNLVTKDNGITYITSASLINYPVIYNICHVYENGYIQTTHKVIKNLNDSEESRKIMVDTINQRFGSKDEISSRYSFGEIAVGIVYGSLSDRSFVLGLTKPDVSAIPQQEMNDNEMENINSKIMKRLLGR